MASYILFNSVQELRTMDVGVEDLEILLTFSARFDHVDALEVANLFIPTSPFNKISPFLVDLVLGRSIFSLHYYIHEDNSPRYFSLLSRLEYYSLENFYSVILSMYENTQIYPPNQRSPLTKEPSPGTNRIPRHSCQHTTRVRPQNTPTSSCCTWVSKFGGVLVKPRRWWVDTGCGWTESQHGWHAVQYAAST